MNRVLFILLFIIIFSASSISALAENSIENPYENISLDSSQAIQVTNHTRANITDTFYFQIHGTTYEVSIDRLKIFTTPYAVVNNKSVIDIGNYLGSGYNELLYSDNSGDIRLKSSIYDAALKEHLIFSEGRINEVGYNYDIFLTDWTTTEFDPETNTTYEHTELAENSTVDINLDQWGNAVIYINGAQTVVLPKPFAVDNNEEKYSLSWELDKENKILKITGLEALKDAAYPITIDPTELVTNGGFETGSFSGWNIVVVNQVRHIGNISISTARKFTGTYSALYGVSAEGDYWSKGTINMSQSITASGVSTVTWHYNTSSSGSGIITNTIGFGTNTSNVKSGSTTNLWYNRSMNITSGTEVLYVYFSGESTSNGEWDVLYYPLWLDDISMLQGTSAPVADFTANITTVTSAQPIQFTDLSTNSPTSWQWDFNGDGVIDSTVQNPVVTYGTAGTYTVSLTATNAAGSDTETKTGYITITDTGGCIACNFSGVPTSGYTPLTVQFTDLSAVEPDTWSWSFGDGETSTQQNPEHTYTSAGTYTVTMTVTKGTAIKTKTKLGYITVSDYSGGGGGEDPGPYSCDFIANLTYGTVPLSVLFNDTSASGANAWTWGIDGVYQTDTQDMTVTFNNAGIYSINHTASGLAGSGSKTKTNYIQVYPPNYGGIYGYIYDANTNQPMSNVNCQLTNSSATASILSDSAGYYYFWPVYNGIYNLSVSKNGYVTGSLPNTIIEGNTLRQDIFLTPSGDQVSQANITNYSSDWLTFNLYTNENNKTISLTYTVTNGTTSYANCTIYSDTGQVYTSNISTQSGSFSFTGAPNTNYLVSFDIMNTAGNRYSGAYPILFYRGFSSSNPVFPPDMPQGIINGIIILAAIVCMMFFGKAYAEIGMFLGVAVLASSYIWGFLNLPSSVQTPVIIFLTALIAGGEYIAKKKILG